MIPHCSLGGMESRTLWIWEDANLFLSTWHGSLQRMWCGHTPFGKTIEVRKFGAVAQGGDEGGQQFPVLSSESCAQVIKNGLHRPLQKSSAILQSGLETAQKNCGFRTGKGRVSVLKQRERKLEPEKAVEKISSLFEQST